MEKMSNNTPHKKSRLDLAKLWQDRRMRSILLSGALILLCVAVYVVLLLTVLQPDEETLIPTVGNHGEQVSPNGNPYIVDMIKKDQLRGVKVVNKKGGFHYYRGEDGQFYFEGAEAIIYETGSDYTNGTAAPEEAGDVLGSISMTLALETYVCQLVTLEEVVGARSELAAYGLEGEGYASLYLTYVDGQGQEVTSHVVFGNPAADGSGYYARLEGRDAIYIMPDTYITRCIFADVKDYFLPQVAVSVSSATYMEAQSIVIKKHGKEFVAIRHVTDEEYTQNGEVFTHVFTYPDGYYPSADALQKVFGQYLNFAGDSVVEYNITERIKDEAQKDSVYEMLRLYSLLDENNQWICEVKFDHEECDSLIYISEKLQVQEEGAPENAEPSYVYYVYSPDFDTIVEFSAEDIPWAEWDLLSFLDTHSYSVTIDNTASIELHYGETRAKFTLDGTGDKLKVTASNGVAVVTDNFRQLYKAILFTTLDGYADQPEGATEILSMKITLRDGKVYDYKFYGMTARKAYYTLNGSGEFYINRDYVKQIISATNGLLAGETITVEKKQ